MGLRQLVMNAMYQPKDWRKDFPYKQLDDSTLWVSHPFWSGYEANAIARQFIFTMGYQSYVDYYSFTEKLKRKLSEIPSVIFTPANHFFDTKQFIGQANTFLIPTTDYGPPSYRVKIAHMPNEEFYAWISKKIRRMQLCGELDGLCVDDIRQDASEAGIRVEIMPEYTWPPHTPEYRKYFEMLENLKLSGLS